MHNFFLFKFDFSQLKSCYFYFLELRNRRSTNFLGVPKFIMEVLSDATEVYDRNDKMELYKKVEVAEYWIVDWRKKQVEMYVLSPDENSIAVPSDFKSAAHVPALLFSVSVSFVLYRKFYIELLLMLRAGFRGEKRSDFPRRSPFPSAPAPPWRIPIAVLSRDSLKPSCRCRGRKSVCASGMFSPTLWSQVRLSCDF